MTVYTEQASFWDGCHLAVTVSTNGIQGGQRAGGSWAEVALADPDGTYHLLVQVSGAGATGADRPGTAGGATPPAGAGPAGEITIRARGDAQVMVLAEALEWSGRHLRELAGRGLRYPESDS